MSELRRDPVDGRWVIIASERGSRPQDFIMPKQAPREGFCPFCPGHEDKTPPEILGIRNPGGAPNGPNWQVRVVPNKFPALQIEGDLDRHGRGHRNQYARRTNAHRNQHGRFTHRNQHAHSSNRDQRRHNFFW